MAQPRVLVLFGGVSSEHSVSCLTAAGVLAAIDPERYQVVTVGITADGHWTPVDRVTVQAYGSVSGLPQVAPGPEALLFRDGPTVALATRRGDKLTDLTSVDVALPLLHGPFGEDGTVQGWFELLGLPYVGAGVLASAACTDKITTKRLLAQAGLPVGPSVGLDDWAWRHDREACLARVDQLRPPWFVKPSRGGSSVGISRVEQREDLAAAIAEARRWDPRVIVEQGVTGAREIECGVLIDRRLGPPTASLPGEIKLAQADRFYDFGLKYLSADGVDLMAPAALEPAQTTAVQELAVAACLALDVEGLARVDSFVKGAEIVINEVNTMPGFTAISLFPRLWGVSGVSYPELIARLLDEALSRPPGLR
ncbi:MAG: D-alanine--D-alanine ligase [Propionibacteriaceae bacterium]|jgi:D-alanine-D-alanine ligase|nr:D-alanine--D-alanine ligase [Propionibacteriaceae bacterium]